MDTNGCSAGFSPRCFGKNHSISSCFLSSKHIPGAAGRWGGLNQPPAGFRDAPTQKNQATPLARLQTGVSNTVPGLKAKSFPSCTKSKGVVILYLQGLFPNIATAAQNASPLVLRTLNLSESDKPISDFWCWTALFPSRKPQIKEEKAHSDFHPRHYSFKLFHLFLSASFHFLLLL